MPTINSHQMTSSGNNNDLSGNDCNINSVGSKHPDSLALVRVWLQLQG